MTIPGALSITAMLLLGLGACTVTQLSQDVHERQARVDGKEQALATDEARQQALRAEFRQLQTDLQRRQMSFDELQAGLDRLQRQNALAAEQTQQQAARKRQLGQQLKLYQDEVGTLRRSGDMSVEEKRKRLDHVQNEIKKALELLLQS